MSTLTQIIAIAAAVFIAWFVYSRIKRNPEAFSKANISKSFLTAGFLGLLLIAFVAFLVLMLNA